MSAASKGATGRPWSVNGATAPHVMPVIMAGPSVIARMDRQNVRIDEQRANADLIVSAVNERAGLLSERDMLRADYATEQRTHQATLDAFAAVRAERDALAERVAELEGALGAMMTWAGPAPDHHCERQYREAYAMARAALSGGKGGAA